MKAILKISLLILISIVTISNSAFAQSDQTVENLENKPDLGVTPEIQPNIVLLENLATILKSRSEELRSLRRTIFEKGDDAVLRSRLESLTAQAESARRNFEQLAISNIDTRVFEEVEEPESWQEELLLIVKPLLQNLRGLTEEPRKREELRQQILSQATSVNITQKALDSINRLLANQEISPNTATLLTSLKDKWQRQLADSKVNLELAQSSLDILNHSDFKWYESLENSLKSFAKERGLTLFLASVVVLLVVFFFKAINALIAKRKKRKSSAIEPNYYRIIAYSQKLMTVFFCVIGVMFVFIIRGDVLLVALMCVLIFLLAISLRNIIPNFLQETRVLLNIGPVRENEIVTYNGIPWRVATLNVFSKLVNPEIKGVLRLPLEEIKELSSRPMTEEKMFPSSIGDWIFDDAKDRIYQVISQSPDSVEIQSAQNTNKTYSTSDYYSSGFINLTRSKSLRITNSFGVDYNLQAICLTEIPKKMHAAILQYLHDAELGTDDIKAKVEFKAANSSSLDYHIIVHVDPVAAPHFNRIKRLIQQACVQLCNEEGWGIPFPQLTIHRP